MQSSTLQSAVKTDQTRHTMNPMAYCTNVAKSLCYMLLPNTATDLWPVGKSIVLQLSLLPKISIYIFNVLIPYLNCNMLLHGAIHYCCEVPPSELNLLQSFVFVHIIPTNNCLEIGI